MAVGKSGTDLPLTELAREDQDSSLLQELFDFVLSAGVVPFFGIRPLSTLIGFAVIPAHQRMVFESGIRLVWKSFCAAFIQIIVPWFADTEIAAMMVGNMTEGARSEIAKHQPRPASLPDEL